MKERGGRKEEKRPASELVEKFPYLARTHTRAHTHTHILKLNRCGLNAAKPHRHGSQTRPATTAAKSCKSL